MNKNDIKIQSIATEAEHFYYENYFNNFGFSSLEKKIC